MFKGPVNARYDIFINPEKKPIVEALGHIYELLQKLYFFVLRILKLN